jgi:hypothetical protein
MALAGASVAFFGVQPAGATNVSTEAELRAAYGDASETQVNLTGDIDLTCAGGGELLRNSATAITVSGAGFTITQTCDQNRVLSQSGSGAVTFEDVTITGGQAVGNGGGGIWATGGGLVTLNNAAVVGNRAPATGGGGINAEHVVLNESSVSGNSADDFGGGLNVDDVTLNNSTVSGNTSAGRAGGIGAADVTVINSTVSGNSAGRIGGGIYVFNATLIYATVVDNSSPNQANVYAQTAIASFGSVVALPQGGGTNCGGGAATTTNGYNFSDDASCGLVGSTDHQSGGDPMLGALADNGGDTETHLPQTGSPLLNAIPFDACENDGATGVTNDQRSIERPQGTGCDIGSVELAATAPPATSGTTAPPGAATSPKFTG